MSNNINENLIISLLKKHDEEAIKYVISDYKGIMSAIIWKHLSGLSEEDREECFSDTLLDIWQHGSSYDKNKSSLKNWIAVITKYNCIDYLRRYSKRVKTENIDELDCIDDVLIELKYMTDEFREQIDTLLSEVEPKLRTIILDYYIEGISNKELSVKNNIKEDTLYKKIQRELRKIRKNNKTSIYF